MQQEQPFDYTRVPHDYAHCFNHDCPRAAECLRHLTGLNIPKDVPLVRCVSPSVWPTDADKCPHYRTTKKITLHRPRREPLRPPPVGTHQLPAHGTLRTAHHAGTPTEDSPHPGPQRHHHPAPLRLYHRGIRLPVKYCITDTSLDQLFPKPGPRRTNGRSGPDQWDIPCGPMGGPGGTKVWSGTVPSLVSPTWQKDITPSPQYPSRTVSAPTPPA